MRGASGFVAAVALLCGGAACGRSDAKRAPVGAAETSLARVRATGVSAIRSDSGAGGVARTDTGSGDRTGGIEWYPASRLSQIAEALANGTATARTFGGHQTRTYVEARRTRSGTPEVHAAWIDLTVVQVGRATLLSGGHVDGGQLASPGERRGGTIVGGVSRSIAAGDFFVIPAGVPHQYQVASGDSIRYLTIKVAR
jgi:hypothetical protein